MLESLNVELKTTSTVLISSDSVGFVVDTPGHNHGREVSHELKDVAGHPVLLF